MNIYQFHSNPESLDLYEERFTRVPNFALTHAEHLGGRFPEGEAAIAKNAQTAFLYARDVIKERFPEGEAAIAKDARYAYTYAMQVIDGRFPAGEEEIAKDEEYAFYYEKRFNVKL
jgi:hypothetical protein